VVTKIVHPCFIIISLVYIVFRYTQKYILIIKPTAVLQNDILRQGVLK